MTEQLQENSRPSSDECGESNDEDNLGINTLLVTANVGSLFEDPIRLFRPWLEAFLLKISQLRPQFLALHLQEVGGKTYEKSMEYVQEFVKSLCEAPEMKDFEYIRIYIDEDFNSAEHFTALGSLYFVHQSVQSVRIWNFLTHSWELAEGKSVYSGNIETISSKEKSKFPQHFFPECKWSRKGFMRTRWEINKTVFDLVNIHLFHDASNLAACEEYPSVYCKTRRRALVHTLERFHLDERNGVAPFFVFGDFNFRCDTAGVVKELTENLTAHRLHNIKKDCVKVHFRNSLGHNILTVGKKEFCYADHQLKFKEKWLRKFDRELEPLSEFLDEFPIEFPPSYPYEEDPEMPNDYMSTRCPSWCDRILMSLQVKQIISDEHTSNPYNIIGESVCMGDHKPIYLNIRLKSNQGTYRCCKRHLSSANNKSTSHHNPGVSVTYCDSCPYKSAAYNEILLECKELHAENGCVEDYVDYINGINRSSLEHLKSSQSEETDKISYCKWPSVSINIIDTDNICVCMCKQILNEAAEAVEGAICPTCQNIIKKQSAEHRYELISKRLMLSNNIVVNHIDTQHLSAFIDASQKHQDPYTPESIESHSSCPELNSTSSSITSSNSRSSVIDRFNFTASVRSGKDTYEGSHEGLNSLDVDSSLSVETRQRGVVSPVQLMSRLEDLQKSSTLNLHYIRDQQSGAAGCSDVEDVNKINQPAYEAERCYSRCLPTCCTIN